MKNHNYYMGFGGSIHDFSSALIKGDNIICAIEDERLTKVRYSLGSKTPVIPSLNKCLQLAKISKKDIKLFLSSDILEWEGIPNELKLNHHLSHAFHAYYTSDYFGEAIVIIADGAGSITKEGNNKHFRETLTAYLFNNNSYREILKIDGLTPGSSSENTMEAITDDSIGDFYKVATINCGFSFLQAGKTMALASFGASKIIDNIDHLYKLNTDGTFSIKNNEINRVFSKLKAKYETKKNFSLKANIAYAAQKITEELLLHVIKYLKKQTQIDLLCYAGGVALNSKANHQIASSRAFSEIYIPSAPGDNGTALGAAIYGAIRTEPMLSNKRWTKTPYLGPIHSNKVIINSEFSVERDNIENKVSEMLSKNKIVGIVRGKSEFGPRALGNRSILANPNNSYIRERINGSIKGREWFRPLAPVVRDVDASKYFNLLNVDSFAMQFVVKVKKKWQNTLISAAHVDFTARIQIVNIDSNKFLYNILTKFCKNTGFGVLINTSLNIQGHPIVETYEDALNVFKGTEIDALVLDNVLIIK